MFPNSRICLQQTFSIRNFTEAPLGQGMEQPYSNRDLKDPGDDKYAGYYFIVIHMSLII